VFVGIFLASAAFFAGPIESESNGGLHLALSSDPVLKIAPAIRAVAFSPDGQLLATCGDAEAIDVWSVASLQARSPRRPESLRDETARHAIAFSPDSQTLVAAGEKSLTVWKRHGDTFAFEWENDSATYRCLAFSADGRSLALGGDDAVIRILDMPARQPRLLLTGHKGVVRTLSFSPDGKRLLSSCQDRLAILWDLESGKPIRKMGGAGPGSVLMSAYSPDGESLAVTECVPTNSPIVIYDSVTLSPQARLSGHTMGVNGLSYSEDGRLLASCGNDGRVFLWGRHQEAPVSTFVEQDRNVCAVALSRDGRLLAYGCNDGRLEFRDIAADTQFTVDPEPHSDSSGVSLTEQNPPSTKLEPEISR
jgi:WD40 repeat protein